jgi:protocatechuate 3,4-dioxygenase alpha subunit
MKQTASQTIGPFFHYCLTPESYGHRGIASENLQVRGLKGDKIQIAGRVVDGAGTSVSDAIIEIWQADASGAYSLMIERGEFTGFGRTRTDAAGQFHFDTIKPGAVPGRGNAWQAPHISIILAARGMLSHVFTRLYFADESKANALDPVLNTVPAERRNTLIATADAEGVYRFDIRLQGEDETVFFDV